MNSLNSKEMPIIIMGFGRSGTTWVSDIISKMIGGLILFEPFHPAVSKNAVEFLYSSKDSLHEKALLHIDDVLNKNIRCSWLLRNHLPVSLDNIDTDFISELWKECNILGFKEIRINFMLKNFLDIGFNRIVFVIRNPLAVLSSIKLRDQFWGEFSFDYHFHKFIAEVFSDQNHITQEMHEKKGMLKHLHCKIEKEAFLWGATHEILSKSLINKGVYLLQYENLYTNPFDEVRKLRYFLGDKRATLHPSVIFTPSMTTNKTLHGNNLKKKLIKKGPSFFWKDTLTTLEVEKIINIVREFDIPKHSNLLGRKVEFFRNLENFYSKESMSVRA